MVLRMKTTLFALRLNELLGGVCENLGLLQLRNRDNLMFARVIETYRSKTTILMTGSTHSTLKPSANDFASTSLSICNRDQQATMA